MNTASKSSSLEIIRLAIPLILSSSGLVLMQFVDGVFLARYSSTAIAAAGSASMVSYMVSSFMMGVLSYTSPFTANLVGAKLDNQIGSTIWQGVYLALIGGAIALALAPFTLKFFTACGHDPALAQEEATYLKIILWGSWAFYVSIALSGFFSGRGDNVKLMLASLAGQVLNCVGDWVLIFGNWGFPKMGVAGAALATSLSNLPTLIILLTLFLTQNNRRKYASWSGKKWHPKTALQLLKFGLSSGCQQFIDAFIWTLFMMIVGSIGVAELAATSIAFRLNQLSFQPLLGFTRGAATCVGREHGARNPEGVRKYNAASVKLCEAWMCTISAIFVIFNYQFIKFFQGDDGSAEVLTIGANLLYFVAAYSIGDGLNISLCSTLQAVGDTKFTAIVIASASAAFAAAIIAAFFCKTNIYVMWTISTLYVSVLPVFFWNRFKSGKWKNIVVAQANT